MKPTRRPGTFKVYAQHVKHHLSPALGHIELTNLFRMSITLGLRKGECLGPRWQDVDFDAQTITPRYQVTRRGAGVDFAELKTDKSRRVLPLPETLAGFLRELRRQQLQQRIASDAWVDNGLVFTNERGGTVEPSILNRHLTRILKAAVLPECHVHDLRHNCASFLHAQGVDIKTVSKILGHSNIQIRADLYTHVFASVKQQAISAIDRMFAAHS